MKITDTPPILATPPFSWEEKSEPSLLTEILKTQPSPSSTLILFLKKINFS